MKLGSNIYDNIMDFLKKRSIEFVGLLLITIFVFFVFSLINYAPEKATMIFKPDGLSEGNLFEIYGNAIADFFLQSFGLISFLLAISIFSWGINLIINKKINNIINKIFYTILYIIFGCLFIYITNNNSFWLIDNGNSGFLGEESFNFLYEFFPLVENNIYKTIFLILSILFFILASEIKIKNIGLKILNLIKGLYTKKNIEGPADDEIDELPKTILEKKESHQQSFSFKI